MKKKFYAVLTMLFASMVILNCTKDKAKPYCEYSDCKLGEISYENDIKPMIENHCVTNLGPGTGCHDAWIFNFSSLVYRIDNGMIPNEVIDTRDMPPIPNDFNIDALTEEQIRLWRCWICDGTPQN